jgi:hypothetical protein
MLLQARAQPLADAAIKQLTEALTTAALGPKQAYEMLLAAADVGVYDAAAKVGAIVWPVTVGLLEPKKDDDGAFDLLEVDLEGAGAVMFRVGIALEANWNRLMLQAKTERSNVVNFILYVRLCLISTSDNVLFYER